MPAHITITFDYSDDDPTTLLAVPRPEPKWLHMNVEGERAITQIFLPTVALDMLKDTVWESWIVTIQGPVMGHCDITLTQHRLLLDIALTYHAFTSGTASVPNIWYTNFICTLINITCTHDHQSIHELLLNLTAAL